MNIKNLLGYDLTLKTEHATIVLHSAGKVFVRRRRLVAFSDPERYEQCQDHDAVKTEIELAGAKLPVHCNGRMVNVIDGLPPPEETGDIIVSREVCDEMARVGRRHSGRVFCPECVSSSGNDTVVTSATGLVYRDDVSRQGNDRA